MTTSPTLSIIVPMYEVEKYIAETISSIVSQTFDDFELILVDDGSPDSSGAIADAFAGADVRVRVIHQHNAGVSSARNVGLDQAIGQYVTFVDGDDVLACDYFERMVELARTNDADLVIATKVLASQSSKCERGTWTARWSASVATERLLYPGIALGSWNKLYSRQMLEDGNLRFRADLFMGEGLTFIVGASQIARVIVSTDLAGYYYRRDNAISATSRASASKAVNAVAAAESVRASLRIINPQTERAADYHIWMTKLFALIMISEDRDQIPDAHVVRMYWKGLRRGAVRAISSPVSIGQRIRAAVVIISPRLYIWMSSRWSL